MSVFRRGESFGAWTTLRAETDELELWQLQQLFVPVNTQVPRERITLTLRLATRSFFAQCAYTKTLNDGDHSETYCLYTLNESMCSMPASDSSKIKCAGDSSAIKNQRRFKGSNAGKRQEQVRHDQIRLYGSTRFDSPQVRCP